MSISQVDEDTQWLQSLQSFLNKTLQIILPDKAKRFRLLDAESMKIWAKAFTHETVDYNDNYEELETLGDKMTGAAFTKYLLNKYPYLKKSHLTQLNAKYMDVTYNNFLARKLGFGPYIRVVTGASKIFNIEADVFESFFGALSTIADDKIEGTGFVLCYNMIIYLFKDVKMNIDRAESSAKNQVQQIFTRFDLDAPKEDFTDNRREFVINVDPTPQFSTILERNRIKLPLEPESTSIGIGHANERPKAKENAYDAVIEKMVNAKLVTVTEESYKLEGKDEVDFKIVLTKENLEFLSSLGKNIEDPVIADVTAPTKTDAQSKAYEQALDTLEEYGITSKWAANIKLSVDLTEPTIKQYVPTVEKRLKSEGYEGIHFATPQKLSNNKGTTVQLIGRKPNGRSEILGSIFTKDRANSFAKSKAALMQAYASGNKLETW